MSSYISEFLEAMSSNGLTAKHASEITETGGRWKNYHLIDNKNKNPKGAYRLTVDSDGAVGQFKDRRIDDVRTWNSKSHKPATPEEKAAYKERMATREKEQADALEKQYAEAAQEAKCAWKAASPVIDHPYLKRKGIQAHGAKMDADGNLILPRYDFKGKLWSYQQIDQKGDKKFQYNGLCNGTYMPLADKADDKSLIVIATGFATCASIREALNVPVICAYNDGNLIHVAKAAKKKYPDTRFIIAADNDAFTFKTPRAEAVKDINKEDIAGDDPRWNEWRDDGYLANSGITKSNEAGHAIGASVIWPEFADSDLSGKPTDFNDYHKLYGLEAVKEKLSAVREPTRGMDLPPLAAYESDVMNQTDNSMLWMDLCEFKDRRTGLLNKDFSLHNATILLSHKQPVAGCFVYDEFLNKETVIKPLPWDDAKLFTVREVDSNDVVRAQLWLEGEGVRLGKAVANDIIKIVCQNRKINPAIEYLDALEWDKKPRLNIWLTRIMGAKYQPAEYIERVGSCWLIAAAKRIYNPGTPFHHMLVLEGGQGAMKSTSLATLATFGKDAPRAYFSDRITFDMIDRADFAVHADGNIILEFQELSGMGKKDRNKVKQWITLNCDEFRKPYDPLPSKFPRKFVLAGTTNDMQYLNDPTGDRRFWPVKVGTVDINLLKQEREQLWAEAVYRHKASEIWYIEPDDPVYKLMQAEQSARYTGDPWDDCITQFVESRYSVTADEIFQDLLKMDKSKWDRISRARICDILMRLGYENKVVRDEYSGKSKRKWVLKNTKPAAQDEEIPF